MSLFTSLAGRAHCIRLNSMPQTFDTSAWFFSWVLVIALSFAAFRISLGGTRPLKDTDDRWADDVLVRRRPSTIFLR